ncbi:DUF1049 domain-containing protein [Rhodocyclus tenuis]|uniref:DUF1049 domain-containing protein n=2 Tax=Rhodocyclus TaxID=1064 RepID=A0A6L5JUZ7_RHOTE|nr:LapA family protein [Rhodocyclus gracilis]MQY50370.1 DUF1049 domain-containing protein [Rhodocyclus gracilis]MRD71734.1 DUF1049 domain-containing protein [Rhodocyclus gracilis]NJA87873.1 DUF1049 domain-containing protein [Rhodocyclus gracilis]
MRALLWATRFGIFLFLLGFALKNTDPVRINFFFATQWQAPMIIVVLAFFVAGAVLGILSLLGVVYRMRRELGSLRRAAALVAAAPADLSNSPAQK